MKKIAHPHPQIPTIQRTSTTIVITIPIPTLDEELLELGFATGIEELLPPTEFGEVEAGLEVAVVDPVASKSFHRILFVD
jgi:hypothetical protein